MNGVSVPFNLDTGSQCNVISKETYNALCTDQLLDKSTSRLITYSGHKMIPCGQKDLVCEYRDKSYIQRFQVVDKSAPSILGRVMMVDDSMNCAKIVSQYDTLFNGLGCLPGYHHINIKPDVKPVIHDPRKVPITLRDRVQSELQRIVDMGVIVRQDEPTEWVSSI